MNEEILKELAMRPAGYTPEEWAQILILKELRDIKAQLTKL